MLIVQVKVYSPAITPVTVVDVEFGEVITAPPGPAVCVQVPVSVAAGAFPIKVMGLNPHTFCIAPPVIDATVVVGEMVITTVSRVVVQPPRSNFHSNVYVPFIAPVTGVLN